MQLIKLMEPGKMLSIIKNILNKQLIIHRILLKELYLLIHLNRLFNQIILKRIKLILLINHNNNKYNYNNNRNYNSNNNNSNNKYFK